MILEMHDEETDTNTGTLVEVQPSLLPTVGGIIALGEETLVILQDVFEYQLIQGMQPFSYHIVSMPLIETYGDMPSRLLHDQGIEQHANLEQHHIIAQRILDIIKEEMKSYPSSSMLSCIQPFELKCRVSEDGMSMILCTMVGYEFNIVPFFEAKHVSPYRSTTLYISSNEEKRTHSLWEHSNGSFIHEAMEEKMIDGRHLEMRNIFSFLDDTFSMSISQLKEKLLPAADPKPHWFWRDIDEKRVSWRDLIGGALQHIME